MTGSREKVNHCFYRLHSARSRGTGLIWSTGVTWFWSTGLRMEEEKLRSESGGEVMQSSSRSDSEVTVQRTCWEDLGSEQEPRRTDGR